MTTTAGWPAAQPLGTSRLMLEPLQVDHAEEMARLLDDPRLHTYIGGQPATLRQLRDRYERQVAGSSPDGTELWFNWVVRRTETGKAVGTVQATVTTQGGKSVAEVAWVIASADQRRGYAGEAAAAMVGWLRQHGVGFVIAHVHPEHQASTAVARALGLSPTETTVDGEIRWAG